MKETKICPVKGIIQDGDLVTLLLDGSVRRASKGDKIAGVARGMWCSNCGKHRDEHAGAELSCLFQSTSFRVCAPINVALVIDSEREPRVMK